MIRRMLLSAGISLWLCLLILPFSGIATDLKILPWMILVVTTAGFYDEAAAVSRKSLQFIMQRLRPCKIVSDRKISLLKQVALIAFCGFVLSFPSWGNNYLIDVAVMVWIYSILALGLNIVVGWTGLLNLGYVAFYAIGAYTYSILNVSLHIPFWIGLPISMTTAGIAGFILGLPVLRLRGDYLAIVTLGFGEMTRIILNNWDSLTHGPNGIMNIARPALMGFVCRKPVHYYYLCLFFSLLTVFILNRLYNSRIGRGWISVREDELAAGAMGVNVTRYKLLAFTLGAMFAGMAGSLFASKMTFISPESFTFMESVTILCMVVLGGLGSIPGCLLGAVILVVLPEVMRDFSNFRMLIFGAALIAMMVLRPQGFIPPFRSKRLKTQEKTTNPSTGSLSEC
jgi:branched-chain amino acid transport system permease protein